MEDNKIQQEQFDSILDTLVAYNKRFRKIENQMADLLIFKWMRGIIYIFSILILGYLVNCIYF